jgi:hypothetical protein
MGIADKLRRQDEAAARAAARNKAVRWAVFFAFGLAAFLFVLFYFLLPMWRGAP